MEINGKDLNKVWNGFLILLVIVLGVQYINTDENQRYEGLLFNFKEESYHGIVVNKFIDYENHASRIAILKNNQRAGFYESFYEKIDVGDSLSKKKGDPIVWLYKKNGKILFYDYAEKVERIKRLKSR